MIAQLYSKACWEKLFASRLFLSLWCFGLSVVVFTFFLLSFHANGNWHDASFRGLLEGTAYRPYVLRVLVPWSLGASRGFLPKSFEDAIDNHSLTQALIVRLNKGNLAETDASLGVEYWTLSLEVFLSILLTLYLIAYFLRAFIGSRWRGEEITFKYFELYALAFFAFLLPPFFKFGYVYDLQGMLLFTLSLFFLYRNLLIAYAICFCFTILCRESGVLLLPVFLIYAFRPEVYRKGARYSPVILGGFQLLVFLLARKLISAHFASNPGPQFYLHQFPDHFRWVFGFYSFSDGLVFMFTALMVLCYWFRKPFFLRVSLLVFPMTYALYFLAGYQDEFRVFLEVYPMLFLSVMFTLATWLGVLENVSEVSKG